MIVNRLKEILNDIITLNHALFIPAKQSINNIAICQEVFLRSRLISSFFSSFLKDWLIKNFKFNRAWLEEWDGRNWWPLSDDVFGVGGMRRFLRMRWCQWGRNWGTLRDVWKRQGWLGLVAQIHGEIRLQSCFLLLLFNRSIGPLGLHYPKKWGNSSSHFINNFVNIFLSNFAFIGF